MYLFQKYLYKLFLLQLFIVAFVASPAPADIPAREVRAIWVTRWDYKTPEDVRKIIANCNDHHFNMVLFQVRGNGTVFYKSKIEPWAWELTSDSPATTGQDPGWNPLQLACYEARKKGMELHAYMNVLPGWHSDTPPAPEAGQLWTEHPDWFMVGRDGQKMMPRSNWYSFLNPAHPDVKQYLVNVFLEVVEKYKINGIHFDYIRYPSEIGDYSYDPLSQEMFERQTGSTPEQAPEEWIDWRAEQVTEIEQEIYRLGKIVKPDLIFSAALVADRDRAYSQYFQDSERWLAEGSLDLAIPMAYTDDLARFQNIARSYSDFQKGFPEDSFWAACGIGAHRAGENSIQQIVITRDNTIDGVAIFAYSSLFRKHEPNDIARQLLSHPFQEKARTPWD